MDNIEIIGFVAGVFTASSVLPQIIKSLRTKSTRDISISWSIINLIWQILWVVYWVFINSISLIIMSAINVIMNIIMIILEVMYGKK